MTLFQILLFRYFIVFILNVQLKKKARKSYTVQLLVLLLIRLSMQLVLVQPHHLCLLHYLIISVLGELKIAHLVWTRTKRWMRSPAGLLLGEAMLHCVCSHAQIGNKCLIITKKKKFNLLKWKLSLWCVLILNFKVKANQNVWSWWIWEWPNGFRSAIFSYRKISWS